MEMVEIEFTQYILPYGIQKEVLIPRPKDIAEIAEKVKEKIPGRFACEVLTTGQVSFTYEDIQKEEDVDIEICNNGPEVPHAVDRLIRRLEALTA